MSRSRSSGVVACAGRTRVGRGDAMSAPALTDDSRNALIEQHLDRAQRLARSIARTLPAHVEVEDLIAAAYYGLVDAAQRFDPSRGWTFATLAHYRMRGAIFDDIRARNLWNPKNPQERPHAVELTPTMADRRAMVSDDSINLRRLVWQLPPRERRAIIGRFWYGHTWHELAQSYGVGDNRMSQIKTRALKRLRKRLH